MIRTLSVLVLLVSISCCLGQQATRPIWYRYRTDILEKEGGIESLFRCIRTKQNCSADEKSVKEVFISDFDTDCSDCCIFRTQMLRAIRDRFNEIPEISEFDLRGLIMS